MESTHPFFQTFKQFSVHKIVLIHFLPTTLALALIFYAPSYCICVAFTRYVFSCFHVVIVLQRNINLLFKQTEVITGLSFCLECCRSGSASLACMLMQDGGVASLNRWLGLFFKARSEEIRRVKNDFLGRGFRRSFRIVE